MTPELLVRKAAAEQWEAENTHHGVPFGGVNREWMAMLANAQPGDEIWSWSTDEESWRRLRGWQGMALVRGGEVVDFFVTGMN